MRIVLLGPPGSGKGTQAEMLTDKYSIPHLSTGDILRGAIETGTELGMKAQAYMNEGKLVPDDLVIDLMRERIREEDCREGFLLDGFPRSIPQAESLQALVELDHVVYVDVSNSEIIGRLTGRRSCRECGAIFNIHFKAPQEEGRCDRCGGELYQRDDDTDETVKKRLETYRAQTEPLADFYRERGLLRHIDGNDSIKNIATKIAQALG